MKKSEPKTPPPTDVLADGPGGGAPRPRPGNGHLPGGEVETLVLLLAQEACRPMPGFNRADLNLTPEFQESIRANGVLMPVLVRALPVPEKGVTHEIFAGVRRWMANGQAQHPTLPARVLCVDDDQARNLRLVENLQREGLTALDEARQYEEVLATTGQTIDQLAAAVGVKRSTIFERRRLLKASAPVQKALVEGALDAGVAGLLAGIPDPAMQVEALREVLTGDWNSDGPMSFRAVRELLREDYMVSLKGSPFDQARLYDGTIEGRKGKAAQLSGAGPCTTCPLRSGNMEGSNVGSPDLCTDPACFAAKKAAGIALKLEAAKARGQEAHGPKEAGKFFKQWGGVKGNYVDLNERCAALGYGCDKTWREVLGKHAPENVTLATDRNGEIHELLTETQATDSLKAAGKTPQPKRSSSSSGSSRGAEQKAREEKTKRMRLAADEFAPKICDKLCRADGLSDKVWQLLADRVSNAAGYDAVNVLAKRRGLATSIADANPAIEKWLTAKRTPNELQRFVLEILLLSPGVNGGHWCEPAWEDDFKAAADLAGVKLQVPKAETPKAPAKPAAKAKAAKGGKK